MRILQLHTAYRERGGEDQVVAAEADLLTSHGHEVVRRWSTNPVDPFDTVAALARAPYNRRSAAAVRRLALRTGPDVAHIHNTWFAESTSVIRSLRRAGVPVVATMHNYRFTCLNGLLFRSGRPCTDCLGRVPLSGVLHRCYRGSVALSGVAGAAVVTGRRLGIWTEAVQTLIAPSETVRSALVAGGVPARRVIVKPHFVADPGPRPSPPSASADLLYVGRLAPGKGVDLLLTAWRRLRTSGLRLLIIGEGPLRGELEAVAPAGVRFLGQRPPDEVRRRMHRARTLVFPSSWPEPFGMVLIESLAAGLPVAGTAAGSARDIVAPVPAELLGPPGILAGLVDALSLVASDRVVDAAGDAARRRYLHAYTPEANLPQLLDIYRAAAAA